jgi:hypothetical protein
MDKKKRSVEKTVFSSYFFSFYLLLLLSAMLSIFSLPSRCLLALLAPLFSPFPLVLRLFSFSVCPHSIYFFLLFAFEKSCESYTVIF